MENGRNAALNGGRGSGQTVRRITELYENKIADIKANCDLAIEGRDIKIKELTVVNAELKEKARELLNACICKARGNVNPSWSELITDIEQFLQEIKE